MASRHLELPLPDDWSPAARKAFVASAQSVASAGTARVNGSAKNGFGRRHPGADAAIHVLQDLVDQGWGVQVDEAGTVFVAPPDAHDDPQAEKDRVRQQELLKRNEQLATASVRRFIKDMERPREFRGSFVSVFNLMRDGAELADALLHDRALDGREGWTQVIDPYVQVVSTGDRCPHTGLRLVDVWRYFRHTWANQYTSTPGRTMMLLVRDRAAPFHPVIGIAALGSAIVQIRERDDWIGWTSEALVTAMEDSASLRWARWIRDRLEKSLNELFVEDLVADGLYWPSLWTAPDGAAVDKLLAEAEYRRSRHHRFVRPTDFKSNSRGPIDWEARARSDLFRSKRCLALAGLLRSRMALIPFLEPKPTKSALQRALKDPAARRAIASICRRAKSEAVGTQIADLTVCGAIAPYNEILGGKLVSMLAVSPTVVQAYRDRYRDHNSEIASSMAGRPVTRSSNLVFVGTTSLYGSGSSQYNRVQIPAPVLSGHGDIRFKELGRSRSFGTSHLSNESLRALLRVSEQTRAGVRVNSIFGEGVNPKLRKVRDGLDRLGWPSDELLQHRRQRIVYGVSLVSNLLPYLLGLERRPRYVFGRRDRDVEAISQWWVERWLKKRIGSPEVLARVRNHSLTKPVRHGARVALPPATDPSD